MTMLEFVFSDHRSFGNVRILLASKPLSLNTNFFSTPIETFDFDQVEEYLSHSSGRFAVHRLQAIVESAMSVAQLYTLQQQVDYFHNAVYILDMFTNKRLSI